MQAIRFLTRIQRMVNALQHSISPTTPHSSPTTSIVDANRCLCYSWQRCYVQRRDTYMIVQGFGLQSDRCQNPRQSLCGLGHQRHFNLVETTSLINSKKTTFLPQIHKCACFSAIAQPQPPSLHASPKLSWTLQCLLCRHGTILRFIDMQVMANQHSAHKSMTES